MCEFLGSILLQKKEASKQAKPQDAPVSAWLWALRIIPASSPLFTRMHWVAWKAISGKIRHWDWQWLADFRKGLLCQDFGMSLLETSLVKMLHTFQMWIQNNLAQSTFPFDPYSQPRASNSYLPSVANYDKLVPKRNSFRYSASKNIPQCDFMNNLKPRNRQTNFPTTRFSPRWLF